ncbi:MAG: DUF1329 domain-containing protein [Desulfuromonadaceae bacterium]|nr:DUF1329 domain-containing protein [Desulfuromonadaceae bacterium]
MRIRVRRKVVFPILGSILCALLCCGAAVAAVSAEQAQALKTTLTPMGAERAGNKEGTIPAWDGGYTKVPKGYVNGDLRRDPFPQEKPLLSITAQNVEQYADRLNDGTKAMLKKYPATFRLDVYPTHRTAAAPQWVYDNTFRNATRGKEDGNHILSGAYGGIPFPIPQSPTEIIWNHLLHWRIPSALEVGRGYLVSASGQRVMMSDMKTQHQFPYYFKDVSPEEFYRNGGLWRQVYFSSIGPPMHAGELMVGNNKTDLRADEAWIYLTGQRRTRKLPNPCCDTPSPAANGLMSFDEIDIIFGRMDRFNWKIVGKKEMYIPYNCNRFDEGKSLDAVMLPHHLNPDYVRWELHRVWVVEGNLKPGMRHQAPKCRLYFDEDTWQAVTGDRWDAKGQLWKTEFALSQVLPDIPAVYAPGRFGFYDLISGAWIFQFFEQGMKEHVKSMPRFPDSLFTPDSMGALGVR